MLGHHVHPSTLSVDAAVHDLHVAYPWHWELKFCPKKIVPVKNNGSVVGNDVDETAAVVDVKPFVAGGEPLVVSAAVVAAAVKDVASNVVVRATVVEGDDVVLSSGLVVCAETVSSNAIRHDTSANTENVKVACILKIRLGSLLRYSDKDVADNSTRRRTWSRGC